jgi:hypothetical protein
MVTPLSGFGIDRVVFSLDAFIVDRNEGAWRASRAGVSALVAIW